MSRPGLFLALPLTLGLMLALPVTGRAQGIDLSGGGPVDVTATDGIEWRQTEQVIIARGNARASRDSVTVNSDRLLARYRPANGAPSQPARPTPAPSEGPAGGNSEIWRLEAEGSVTIKTPTDTARGDRAVYDMDQAVLVLTGRDLSLATPTQLLTARDSLEYWSTRRMAVARGNAVAVDSQEGRRIGADTLVSYLLPEGATPPATTAAPRPAAGRNAAAVTPAPDPSPGPGTGKVDRVEAFGNVEIRTATEVVRGDRGVYSPATGMARLLGEVRITRGDNQLNGREAIVNLRTGVARLVASADRGERVRGLIVPERGTSRTTGQTPTGQLPTPRPSERRAP